MMPAVVEFWRANHAALGQRVVEHLQLMFLALLAATVVGLPAGVVAARVRWLAGPFLALANLVQTIPSVALLGFLLPLFGVGQGTASVALFLYALLPIIRNTITGLVGVAPAVVDAARGMGMSERQVLLQVELPLARPVIFAGVRTAAVINVGVTTLSALVGAGGLGTFIFRGLATNNTAVILLGAIPAAALALAADGVLAAVERGWRRGRAGVGLAAAAGTVAVLAAIAWPAGVGPGRPTAPRFGFTAEFMERADGYQGWRKHYGLPAMETREFDPGLLYEALRAGEIDVACGFSTDGRIGAFQLRQLRDDRSYFPVYAAALLVRQAALKSHPDLGRLLTCLQGALDETRMRELNRKVDRDGMPPARVAAEFLAEWAPRAGVPWSEAAVRAKDRLAGPEELVVGTKNFTEQYVLGQIVRQLINGASPLRAGLKSGLGGTAICVQALQRGDIDLYPEYSGTVLATVLKPPPDRLRGLLTRPAEAATYLRSELAARFGFAWVAPLGFNNTYALLVRDDDPAFASVHSVSDLVPLLGR
ncbi:MAG: ABC transporter permease/substrate-binding protein [Verrucomicrobia bacterium]|nr:ABC transporter permease/substrate-binding protein [Verrucomicrobiota bacterium]